jgi:hypothetical protein
MLLHGNLMGGQDFRLCQKPKLHPHRKIRHKIRRKESPQNN